MARPQTFSELTKDQQRGERVVSFEISTLPPTSALLAAVAAFVKAAESAHLSVVNERYGTLNVHTVKSPEEQDSALRQAQEAWDDTRRKYDAALFSGTEPTGWDRTELVRFSEANSIPAPWTPEAQADADGSIAALLS